MKNLTPSWTRITEKRGDNLKKAELNALAVRARDGSEETLLDLWNAVKGFVKKKAVYYAKNHTAGMTTAEDLVQAGFFAVYDTVQAFDETREKSFLTLLKYFLQKRFAEEAGVRTSRRDGLQYADSTAEALYSNEDSITLEDTLEDTGAAAELESVEYRDLVLYARRVILAALDGLPDGYRILLAEHYFHNVPLVAAALLAGYSSRASVSEAHRRALRHLRTYSKYKGELRACLDAFEEVTPYLSAAGNTGAGSYIRTGISSTEGSAIAGNLIHSVLSCIQMRIDPRNLAPVRPLKVEPSDCTKLCRHRKKDKQKRTSGKPSESTAGSNLLPGNIQRSSVAIIISSAILS